MKHGKEPRANKRPPLQLVRMNIPAKPFFPGTHLMAMATPSHRVKAPFPPDIKNQLLKKPSAGWLFFVQKVPTKWVENLFSWILRPCSRGSAIVAEPPRPASELEGSTGFII
jgi:hypothetical protein